MTEASQEFRDQMKRELAAAAIEDLKIEVKRVQAASGISFEEAWRRVELESPGLFRGSATLGSSPERGSHQSYFRIEARARELIYESGGALTMGRALEMARGDVVSGSTLSPLHPDPRITREMGKITKLNPESKTATVGGHIQLLAKIRKFMSENPGMTYDAAFTEVCRQEAEAKKAPATAGLAVNAVEPKPKGRTLLVRGSEAEYID